MTMNQAGKLNIYLSHFKTKSTLLENEPKDIRFKLKKPINWEA